MNQISAGDLVKLIDEGKDPYVIDVRERVEWDYYHLDEAKLIPMNTIPSSLSDIPDDRDVYIVCGHGVRSQTVCRYLEQEGWDNVVNVIGGMAAVGAVRGFQYD